MAKMIRKAFGIRASAALLAVASGHSNAAGIEGTYTDWIAPQSGYPAGGYASMYGTLSPLNELVAQPGQVAPAYFYAAQFGFADGDGAYIGIQIRPGAEWGKLAIFSVWGANAATCADVPGAICQPFAGEGEGYQTLIHYNWIAGRTYRVRVSADGSDAGGDWWRGEIVDMSTQAAQLIGRIRVPSSYAGVSYYVINWVEWFAADPGNCDAIPQSIVRFSAPVGQPGSIVYGGPGNHPLGNSPFCPSSITTLPDGSVIHYNGKDRIFVDGLDG